MGDARPLNSEQQPLRHTLPWCLVSSQVQRSKRLLPIPLSSSLVTRVKGPIPRTSDTAILDDICLHLFLRTCEDLLPYSSKNYVDQDTSYFMTSEC